VFNSQLKSLVRYPLAGAFWSSCFGLFIAAFSLSYGLAPLHKPSVHPGYMVLIGIVFCVDSVNRLHRLATRKLVHFASRAVWPADGTLDFPEPDGPYELMLTTSYSWSEYHGTIEIMRLNDRIGLITLPRTSAIFANRRHRAVVWNGRNDTNPNSKATLKFGLTPTRPEPKLSSGRVEKLEVKIFVRTRPQ
jgi:hypothetical protein